MPTNKFQCIYYKDQFVYKLWYFWDRPDLLQGWRQLISNVDIPLFFIALKPKLLVDWKSLWLAHNNAKVSQQINMRTKLTGKGKNFSLKLHESHQINEASHSPFSSKASHTFPISAHGIKIALNRMWQNIFSVWTQDYSSKPSSASHHNNRDN